MSFSIPPPFPPFLLFSPFFLFLVPFHLPSFPSPVPFSPMSLRFLPHLTLSLHRFTQLQCFTNIILCSSFLLFFFLFPRNSAVFLVPRFTSIPRPFNLNFLVQPIPSSIIVHLPSPPPPWSRTTFLSPSTFQFTTFCYSNKTSYFLLIPSS
jgi:hypothetical protein